MRVRMVTTAAGPAGVFYAGETWDLDDVMAGQFVAAGAAVALTVSRETLPVPPVVEEATVAPPETAVLPRSKPRGRK